MRHRLLRCRQGRVASDAPLAPIPVHVKVLDQVLGELKLGPEVRRKMMVGNAEKLLNMKLQ